MHNSLDSDVHFCATDTGNAKDESGKKTRRTSGLVMQMSGVTLPQGRVLANQKANWLQLEVIIMNCEVTQIPTAGLVSWSVRRGHFLFLELVLAIRSSVRIPGTSH